MPRSPHRTALFLSVVGLAWGVALGGDGSIARHAAWWETDACHDAPAFDEPASKSRADFDEATGRTLLNYPPHRFADSIHMRLAIDIPDMNSPRFDATETLTLAPLGIPLPEFSLDCGPRGSMDIRDVKLGGPPKPDSTTRRVTFSQDDERLRVMIDPPVPVGEQFDVVISYTLNDPPEGITWTPESPAWPGRPAQLHSQGEPESNHYWFPCHDSPNERLTTELEVTVPEGFTVVSNGRLLDKSSAAGGRQTFHWLQDKAHENYLVTMVVGRFDVVDVGTSRLPMPVYAPLGRGGDVERSYGRTPQMIRAFERVLDEPFPWDKYAQVIVHNFGAGGMENTSATTMYDTSILDRTALLDGDLDGLISHELAHQWFGDLMTCNSWEYIWLNEGFATYFSQIWAEERDGMDGYLSGIYGNFHGVIANDHADAPFQTPMCSKEWSHPWEVFRRAANPYPKGASILHMLRVQLGDDLFVQGLRTYVDRNKGKTVDNDQLRYAFEDTSGRSLQRFFAQWCDHPGVPHVDVGLEWDSSASQLKVSLKQTQNIDGYNPAFFFTLPIWVKTGGGPREGRWLSVDMDGREASKSFDLPGEPTIIAVNANLGVLADLNIDQPVERWLAQLDGGPTIASRLEAVEMLQKMAKAPEAKVPAEAGEQLAGIVRNDHEYISLRRAAAGALLAVGGADGYLAALRKAPKDARVRAALAECAADAYHAVANRGDATPSRLLDDLRQMAKKDESYGVRSAAVTQLGRIGGSEVRQVIVDSLDAPSQHDEIRRAALGALADLDEADGLALALRYIAPGVPARTRPEAVNAVARLAHHDHDTAVTALVALLDDRESRTANAAGEALVRLGGDKAAQAIRERAARARGDIEKSVTRHWIEQMESKQEHAATTPAAGH